MPGRSGRCATIATTRQNWNCSNSHVVVSYPRRATGLPAEGFSAGHNICNMPARLPPFRPAEINADDAHRSRRAAAGPAVAALGRDRSASRTMPPRPPAGRCEFLRDQGYRGTVYPINPRRETVLGERAWPSRRRAARGAGPRLHRAADRSRDRRGRRMRPGRREGRHHPGRRASPRPARRAPRASSACARSRRETGIRVDRPVEPRRGQSARRRDAHRQRRLRRARHSGRPHLRRPRTPARMIGALMSRGKARGIGFAGLVSVGNEVDLSVGEICALDARRSRTSTATCCSSKPCAMRRRCASSRSAPRRAASRSSPTSSAARRRRASSPSRTPARSPARTMSRARSSPIAASRGSKASKALIEAMPLVRRTPIRPAGARAADGRGGHHHGRRRHHGGRSARDARRRDRAAERRDASRASPPPASRSTPARIVDLTIAGARYDGDEGRARRAHHRAGVRHGAGGGRLLGALPSRARGASRSSTAPMPQSRSRRFSCPRRPTRWRC